jgi:hypothetical protein
MLEILRKSLSKNFKIKSTFSHSPIGLFSTRDVKTIINSAVDSISSINLIIFLISETL